MSIAVMDTVAQSFPIRLDAGSVMTTEDFLGWDRGRHHTSLAVRYRS